MGFLGGISFGQLLVIFLIIAVLFGTKKLRSIGEDLGQAVHGFKKGLKEGAPTETQSKVIPSEQISPSFPSHKKTDE